jgi:hypothetical protein
MNGQRSGSACVNVCVNVVVVFAERRQRRMNED